LSVRFEKQYRAPNDQFGSAYARKVCSPGSSSVKWTTCHPVAEDFAGADEPRGDNHMLGCQEIDGAPLVQSALEAPVVGTGRRLTLDDPSVAVDFINRWRPAARPIISSPAQLAPAPPSGRQADLPPVSGACRPPRRRRAARNRPRRRSRPAIGRIVELPYLPGSQASARRCGRRRSRPRRRRYQWGLRTQ